jgi:type IV secretory pathway component VirB8
MSWDPNEWQGRSKEQVERNNKVFGYSVIMSIIVAVIVVIVLILN